MRRFPFIALLYAVAVVVWLLFAFITTLLTFAVVGCYFIVQYLAQWIQFNFSFSIDILKALKTKSHCGNKKSISVTCSQYITLKGHILWGSRLKKKTMF